MKTELEELQQARENLDAGWDETRASEALSQVERRYRRRKVVRAGAAAAAVLALALGATTLMMSEPDHLAFHDGRSLNANFIELADASRVTPLDDAARILIEEVADEKIRVAMSHGKAHYEVSKRASRRFVVDLDGIEVEVLGTSFDVESSDEAVHVHVHEGRVAVRSTRGNEFHVLSAGDRVTMARQPEEKTETTRLEPAETELETIEPEVELARSAPEKIAKKRASKPEPPAPKKWRQLTDRKKYAEASELLLADPALVDERAVDELFAAADAMRRSGHHAEAADYLEKIVEQHSNDSRAAMAAHTRGRILDRNLSRSCEAAAAFERARKIGLAGMLQRDALAHSATNWNACGEAEKARANAQSYRDAYGEGPHWSKLEKILENDVD